MKDHYDFSEGRRGAVISTEGKTRITIYLDNDILAAFKDQAQASGKGYQTLINDALRAKLTPVTAPLTEEDLRRVLNEVLPKSAA
jgi:uncharacterized protein (DUF4415 family)